jgi:GGDEF domain-containing protein
MLPFGADTVGIAQAVITTLGAVLVIGLAFLPHPNRSTLLWAIGFLLSAIFVLVSVFAMLDGLEMLRRAMMAGLLSCTVFPWAGLRAWRGAPSLVWLFAPTIVVLLALLLLPGSLPIYSVCFRVAFLLAAVYPALAVWEILRLPERTDVLIQPLLIGSAAFVAFAVGSALAGIFYPPTDGDDLTLVRTLNALGMLIYVTCLFVSIVWLAQQRRPATVRHPVAEWVKFRDVARDRLRRAQDGGEQSWALLAVRLDDEATIRAATGTGAFTSITAELDGHVRRIFPADSDIGRQGGGRIVVLVPRSTVVVRELIRGLLKAVNASGDPGRSILQNSASVGWVTVDVGGYDFSALLGAATMAVERASAAGGDRWYRVTDSDLD